MLFQMFLIPLKIMHKFLGKSGRSKKSKKGGEDCHQILGD